MLWISAALFIHAAPEFQAFDAPGYRTPVSGVWYSPGETSSAMPLGALGTGFIELGPDGHFGDSTVENNWLSPAPVGPKSGLVIQVGDRTPDLLADSAGTPEGLRFWGHFPAADMAFGDRFGPVRLSLRAFAPLIPHDYDRSQLPVAFFRFSATNTGKEAAPVTLGLQWDTRRAARDKARGNVEAALGWRRDALGPGETWTVRPVLVFAHDVSRLRTDIKGLAPTSEPLKGQPAPEGLAFQQGEVSEFYLDAFGGFGWEANQRESAVFNGSANLGQLMWQIHYDGKRAGRGPNRPFGVSGGDSGMTTEDGVLGIRMHVEPAGENALALVYTIVNRSNDTVKDLSFAFAPNIDLGGPGKENQGRAAWDAQLAGVVFESDAVSTAVGLLGSPDAYVVGTWPDAHAALDRDELVSVRAPESRATASALPSGLMAAVRNGTYAAGVQGEGWVVSCDEPAAGIIAATAKKQLQPGETSDVVCALAWHFPEWKSSDGETLRHRYAKDYADAGDVLNAALPQAGAIERAIVDWQSKVYASKASPQLKDAVINGLYVLARNSWWMDDGRFFQSESFTGCAITETLVCRFNGTFPLALLFPECERATIREFAKWQAESGQIAFGFGTPDGTKSPMMNLQIPIVSSEYVLLAWRNYALWQNDAYLREAWPSMKRALQFGMTLDTDGDGLINEAPGSETGFPANQYYDIWPWWGTSAYTASIWLAALKAGIAAADQQGDATFANELKGWLDRGVAAYNDKLWTGEYYRLYSGTEGHGASDTSLTNALCGQWYAYATGLDEILPHDRIESVIDTVLRLNAKATPYGAVNGAKPDGSVDESFADHSAVITIGEVWNFCAMAAFAGRQKDAMNLFNASYNNIALRQGTPWNISWSLDRTTGAIKWGINYYSNPCVWTLLQALDPKTYAALGKSP